MGLHEDEIKVALGLEVARRWPGARLLYEVGLSRGQVRADAVALSETELHVFEVKSAADTLRRLPMQSSIYSQVADRCTLVVAERHAEKALALVPIWWSAWAWTPGGLSEIRDGTANQASESLATARLLWREEALAVLRGIGRTKGLSRATVRELHTALVEAVDAPALHLLVRRTLLARAEWMEAHARRIA